MPFSARFKFEEAQVVGNLLGRVRFPRFAVDGFRNKRFDQLAACTQHLTSFNTYGYAVAPQVAAYLAIQNSSVHIQRSEHRVERAGRSMNHERIVEAFVAAIAFLAFNVAVFFVNLRSLREAGQLFVYGLGNEDARIVFVQFQQHR